MRHRYQTITAIGFAALVMVFAFVTSAQAGLRWSGETTHMTFKHPVRIPGVTLPTGSYVFELSQNRQVVWVFSEDDGDVFGPYFVRPRQRRESTSRRAIVVDRTADASGVLVIRAWFGRHQNRGYEFVYPTHSGNRAGREGSGRIASAHSGR